VLRGRLLQRLLERVELPGRRIDERVRDGRRGLQGVRAGLHLLGRELHFADPCMICADDEYCEYSGGVRSCVPL
jgi:hypothetical protein